MVDGRRLRGGGDHRYLAARATQAGGGATTALVTFTATFGPGFYWFAWSCLFLAIHAANHRPMDHGGPPAVRSSRMTHRVFAAACAGSLIVGLTLVSAQQKTADNAAPVPTYTKDVAPILFANCTTCHRPGEIGPMPLLTFDDARPYAEAIVDEVGQGHMPPWHAEAPDGTFTNERRLSAKDKDTLMRWASGGAPKGDPKECRPRQATQTAGSSGSPIRCSR